MFWLHFGDYAAFSQGMKARTFRGIEASRSAYATLDEAIAEGKHVLESRPGKFPQPTEVRDDDGELLYTFSDE